MSENTGNSPDNTGNPKADHRFKPGRSGNPAGRPKGARNKTTLAVEALLAGEAEEIARKVVNQAMAGYSHAQRFVVDRVAPRRRDATIEISLPAVRSIDDAIEASTRLLAAVGNGLLSPGEAGKVMNLLAAHRAMLERRDQNAQPAALEQPAGVAGDRAAAIS